MNYLKRFVRAFLILTAVVVCLTLLPNQAEAATVASGTYGDNLTWVLDDYGTLTISGTGALNAPWWESPWYSYSGSIRSVFIENGVTSIGEYTFEGYPLEWVYISDSVKSIGAWAFCDCTNLYDVRIGEGLTKIGQAAFANCSSLWTINIPSKVSKIDAWAFLGCSRLMSISLPAELTLISSEAFNGCTSLLDVSYQGTEQEKAAMTIQWGNDPLNNATWSYVQILGSGSCGENLTWELRDDRSLIIAGTGAMDDYGYWGTPWHNYMRDNNTFYDYSWNGEQYGINRVVIKDGVTGIANGAFRYFIPYSDSYSNLAVRIPDSIKELPENAFEGCYFGESYSELYLGNENNPYLVLCYAGSIWEYSYTIPETTRFIWSNAFQEWNYNMYPEEEYNVYITDPSAWCNISFNGNYSNPMTLSNNVYLHILGANGIEVTDVVLDATVTQIPQNAFRNASIKSITIPNGVTNIGDNAFYYCNSLTDIDIPDGVTRIGSSAFYGCFNLTGIAIPDTVSSVGKNAFYGVAGNTYDNAKYIGNEQNPYLVLASYTSSDTVTKCTVHSATKIISDGAFADCYALREVTLPNGVISIGASAFSHTEISSVTIPDSVTSIGNSAFSECWSLDSITIPDSVTSIGSSAFSGCWSLDTVTIGKSVTSIGSAAFSGCWSLDSITIPDSVTSIGSYAFRGTAITSVTIPDSVTSIGGYAFSDCYYLTSVTIGKGVNTITNYMFEYCDRLTHAYYEGTSEQWGKIYSFNGGEWEQEWLTGIICLGDYPFVGINADRKTTYDSLTEALSNATGGYIRFNWSAQEDVAVAKDTYIDLNGCTLNGNVTIADGATLYVFDSATADYTADNRGKIVGSVTGDLARFFNTPKDNYGHNYKYLALEEEEDVWSFHRYYLTVKSVILVPSMEGEDYSGTAVDYRTQFKCNDLVAQHVTAYGTKLVGDNTVYADYMASGYCLIPQDANEQRTWLTGTFKSNNSAEINAANALIAPTVSAYIKLADGTEITSAGVQRSLRDMIVYANGHTDLTDDQKKALGQMYDLFRDVLDTWTDVDISNIKQYSAEMI